MRTRSPRRRPQPRLWRHQHLAAPLVALAYLERATVHILLGWLPKVEELSTKIAFGRHQHAAMRTAVRLERTHWAMTRLGVAHAVAVPRRLRAFMMAIDGSSGTRDLVARLYLGVRRALVESYDSLIARCDPVLDAQLLDGLEEARTDAAGQVAWATETLGTDRGKGRAELAALLRAPHRGPFLPRRGWSWAPLDRVPECRRPAALLRPPSGSQRATLADPPGSKGMWAEFFHHVSGSEVSTMEFYGRTSYEHPEMPEEFHQDYSRVTADEARHAEIALRYAADLGKPYGTLAIDTALYDYLYEYEACPPGSKKELLWRLLLQGTFREGLIIEGFTLQAKKMHHDKLDDAARVAETMAAEELPHIEIALKWARHLLGGDKEAVRRERTRAHASYRQGIVDARKRYVAKNLDEAVAETEHRQAYAQTAHQRYPFSLTAFVDRRTRAAAGYTPQEIDQVIRWGYLHP